jgi:hypothetical protein
MLQCEILIGLERILFHDGHFGSREFVGVDHSRRHLVMGAAAVAGASLVGAPAFAHGRAKHGGHAAHAGGHHGVHKASSHHKPAHGKAHSRHGHQVAEADTPVTGAAATEVAPARLDVATIRHLDPQGLIRKPVLAGALVAMERHKNRITTPDRIFIADFGKHSSDARFYQLDMTSGEVIAYRTAHGRGSDPDRSGWAKRFSNQPNSNASSLGAYVTLGVGHGFRHGTHVALDGLDASNSAAKDRAIIVHSADYCELPFLRSFGMLGRSEGCFATSSKEFDRLLPYLGEGRLLYAAV